MILHYMRLVEISLALRPATDLSPLRGWLAFILATHGLRRGLHSFAPSELKRWRQPTSGAEAPLFHEADFAGGRRHTGCLESVARSPHESRAPHRTADSSLRSE